MKQETNNTAQLEDRKSWLWPQEGLALALALALKTTCLDLALALALAFRSLALALVLEMPAVSPSLMFSLLSCFV